MRCFLFGFCKLRRQGVDLALRLFRIYAVQVLKRSTLEWSIYGDVLDL